MAQRESHARSLVKGITWRLIGTIDTLIISFLVLNQSGVTDGETASGIATGIALWDTLIKFVLYYLHERAWQNIPLGMVRTYFKIRKKLKSLLPPRKPKEEKRESHTRSILKGISWRFLGTLTTVLVAFWLTGETSDALKIGGIEVFTKFILYYAHERIWQRIPRGQFVKYFKKNG